MLHLLSERPAEVIAKGIDVPAETVLRRLTVVSALEMEQEKIAWKREK
jgi:hypothetical protein